MADRGKQKREYSILMRAFSASVFARSKEALRRIFGDSDLTSDWQSYDKPDFYRIFDDKIVGIEHFSVDKYAYPEKSGGKIKYQQFVKAAMNTADSVRLKYSKNPSISDYRPFMNEAFSIIGDSIVEQAVIGDRYMFPSFVNSMDDHLSCTDVYRERLRSIANNKHVLLGCLAELSGNFNDVILAGPNGIVSNNDGLLPISHPVLLILSHALAHGFDFVMFYRSSFDFTNTHILADRLFVLDAPVDVYNIGQYCGGEPLYHFIPSSYTRNLRFTTHYASRNNLLRDCTDCIQDVVIHSDHNDGGIDMCLYWSLVYAILLFCRLGLFCYCEIDTFATAYALDGLSATKWGETEYRNSRTGFSRKGIVPYGYNKIAFDVLRFEFINRYRPHGAQSLELLKRRGKLVKNFDNSWLHHDTKKHGARKRSSNKGGQKL